MYLFVVNMKQIPTINNNRVPSGAFIINFGHFSHSVFIVYFIQVNASWD